MEHNLAEEGQTKTASDIAEDRVFNDRFFRSLEDAPQGELTKQAAPGGLYIRKFQRERSIVRRLLDFQTATDEDLVKMPDRELPIMWGQMQNVSKGAVSMSFHDAVDNETFWRETFEVQFFVISTPEYYKNLWSLKNHTHDTVKALTEDCILDIEDQEDVRWFNLCDDIVGPVDGTGRSGMIQNSYFGKFSLDNFIDSKYKFDDVNLPRGTFVVNERFMSNFEKLDTNKVGDDLRSKIFLQGGQALSEGVIGGVNHLFTSKSGLVPNDTVYQFTTEDYLGVAREYQAPTMSMRKEKRTIFFSVEEIIACSLVNVSGVYRGVFQNKE